MKFKTNILIGLTLLFVTSCSKTWEDHYNIYPDTVDMNVWDAMQSDPEISKFVQILKDLKYDTLFLSDNPYTLFAPTNEAIDQYENDNSFDHLLIDYHIAFVFIQSGNIVGKREIQTLGEKFALFERYGSEMKLDGISLIKESSLYKNGKYFVLEKVAKPLPNLYQYFDVTNPVLKDYIDSQDSVGLDRENSKPIGFDENGNTIFDSVLIDYNKFEAKYFPVSVESRNKTATIVFPEEQDYNDALTLMALDMNIPGFVDYTDIPLDWQYDVLIQYLLKHGVFENSLEPEEFIPKSPNDTLKLKNILGDSIQILYTPVEKAVCGNGYAYNYDNFRVFDSLYSGSVKFEAEWLLDETGIKKYAWNTLAKVQSSQFFAPLQEYIKGASNDTTIRVSFPRGYTGNFSLEFNTKNMFPRKYVMIVRTHMNIGGIYDIYVNDELIKTFDYYDFVRYRQVMPSVTGERYSATGNFNNFDMWVDNMTEYGSAKIRFEYKEPGNVYNKGLVIDYIDFVPAEN